MPDTRQESKTMRPSSGARPPERFLSIDQFDSHIAVLDDDGRIMATNAAWRRFAEANGSPWSSVSEGVDYLAVCDRAAALGNRQAADFASRLRKVLAGDSKRFTLEYDCHGNGQERWFIARATRHDAGDGPRVVVSHEDVTALRVTLNESEKRRALFETVAQESPAGIFQCDARGSIEHFNTYFADRMGLAPADVSGRRWWKILHRDDQERAEACWRECVATRREQSIDLRFCRVDGSVRWGTVRIAPLRTARGGGPVTIGTIVETTQRKKMELCFQAVSGPLAHLEGAELHCTALLLACDILEAEIALLAVPRPNGRAETLAVAVGGRIVANFEYELAGTPCAGVMESKARVYPERVRELFPEDSIAAGLGVEGYGGILLTDPQNHPLGILAIASTSRLKHMDGLPALLHLFGTRLASDLDRSHSEARFRDLFEFAPDALVLCGHDGRIVQVNRHAEELFGYERGELVGLAVETLVPDSLRGSHVRLRENTIDRPEIRLTGTDARRLEARRCDGRMVPVEISLATLHTGKDSFAIAAVRDATDRRRMELARIERERLLHLRVAIEDAFATQDALSLMLASVAEQVRLTFEADIVTIDTRTSDDSLPELHVQAGESAAAGGIAHRRICPLRIGERDFGSLAVATAKALGDESSADLASAAAVMAAHLGRVAAESGLRSLAGQLEQRVLERTRELESANRDLDAFAASVSHDLRAPIRRIQGHSILLQESLEGRLEPRDAEALRTVVKTSVEMGSMVTSLLQVARAGRAPLRRREVDLAGVARDVLQALFEASPQRRIEAKVDQLPSAWGDPTLIRQVFENLLSNAVKYTRDCDLALIHVGCEGVQDGRVRLFVRDNGVGFEMAHAGRLFEMFGRLHGSDEFEGSGVGLATVRRILDRHNGDIHAESVPGEETTFYFTLPAAAAPRG